MTHHTTNTNDRRGVSLPEVIVSTLLVGVMVVASMNTLTATHLTYRISAQESLGPGLAQELLSEALAQAYKEPGAASPPIGPDTSESSRRFFDDVDDYHGYSSAPTTRDGTAIADYSGWTRSVAVEWVASDLQGVSSDEGFKLVTVTVTSPGGETTTLSGLRCQNGVLDQAPVETDALVWVGASLQTSTDASVSRTGARLTNLVVNPNP